MNKLNKYLLLIATVLLIYGCTTDPFEPIDIFEQEQISVNADGNIVENGENTMLPVGHLCDGVQLWANKDRVIETPGGFQIKGTVFANTEEGITSISSGDFEIKNNALDELSGFTGFGTFLLPEVGVFKDNVDLADLFGANLQYGSGRAFKALDADLPIVDGDCYFKMTMEESSGFGPGGDSYPLMMGNTAMAFNTMYIQPNIPAILIRGDLDQYSVEDKPAKVVEGRDGRKRFKPASRNVKKKFSIKDLHIGVAAKPHFVFTPNTFSDELEEIVGGTGFEQFQGSMYLKGTIPLKKYPIDITGEAVLRNDFKSGDVLMNVLENSFEETTYELGINGTAEFGHAILDFLPLDTRVQLGNATVHLKTSLNESFVRFAGEYDTDIIGEIVGDELAKLLPRKTLSGKMYGYVGTDLSEWEYYIEANMDMELPGIGTQKLNEAILHITPNGIYLSCFATLPYGIGETEITGEVNRDGTFSLTGRAKAQLELGDARISGDLNLIINNSGIWLDGMASLPGGISDFAIAGEVSAQRVSISGSQMTNINFGNGARLKTDLKLVASTDKGIFLSGKMDTPLDVTMIGVEGKITKRGLSLKGYIDNNVNFGVAKLDADLSVSASTWAGAKVNGLINVPLPIIGGRVEVNGMITGITTFSLDANASAYVEMGDVASAEAGICFGFSQRNIKVGGSAEFCAADIICGEFGIRIKPDWGQGSVELCVDFGSAVGEVCI